MNSPLYISGRTPEGKPLLAGLFRFKDECGFPLDQAIEMARERGMAVDYCELLCAAWLHDCLGFDSVVRELAMMVDPRVKDWERYGAAWLSAHPKALKRTNPIDVFCRYVLARKRLKR